MFTVYYSNQLANQKDVLIGILQQDPNPDPFAQETILVQSLGMAQWLQRQIAEHIGIAGNIQFPYPTNFLWQQYRALLPMLPKENKFERHSMTWRLMRLIPSLLEQENLTPLKRYLMQPDQLKRVQLAGKIADLFDQYLVYRPQWLVHWENGEQEIVLHHILKHASFQQKNRAEIHETIQWQSLLWNALVEDIKQDSDEVIFTASHRAYLQQRYFEKLDNLTESEKALLPPRIFVFGISSLPASQLAVLKKLSEHCHIHLFFTNPSEHFWGDNREEKALEKLALHQHLSTDELDALLEQQGNPLLTTWGKQGKEFLALLTELEPHEINYYDDFATENPTLLTQIKRAIFRFEQHTVFTQVPTDHSVQFHVCHSKMREVEVLHNRLLQRFEQDPTLSPTDVIVMSPDIDGYAPYIHAVFSRYPRHDARFIPFTLSDQKISYVDPIVASFLHLLSVTERKFTVEDVLDLFDTRAIREQYRLTEESLFTLREWINAAGVRAGLHTQNPLWDNYTSWENGLNRLLLGTALTAENGPWQDVLAFNESYGLAAEQSGHLAKFLQDLTAWIAFLANPQPVEKWQQALTTLINRLYREDEDSAGTLIHLHQAVESTIEHIRQAHFSEALEVSVIAQLLERQLSEQRSNLHFLMGKVNFCTLLPMRAIPFNVVCLLGMNEGEFPRQRAVNSFDLMHYAPQKGDRARRDDDRYLFLEAVLSAQQMLYISYIGQSLTDNQTKLPSILVSQLNDYIQANLNSTADTLVHHHPMTAFSPKNFTAGNISYDREWLAAKSQKKALPPFLTPLALSEAELPDEIELADLIAYLQDPIRFFFQHHLGVRFEQDDETLSEAEVFALSPLERYQLLDRLINVKPQDRDAFFRHEKLSGNLPACHFADLTQSALSHSIEALHNRLAEYLTRAGELLEIDRLFHIGERDIRLIGHLPNRFDEEIVLWRVGDLRDRDMIRIWLYHVILAATDNHDVKQIRFYYRQGDTVKTLSFNGITQAEAEALLTQYLRDYLSNFNELTWAITNDLKDYIRQHSAETSGAELCQKAVESYNNVYLQRVMTQTPTLPFDDIHRRTLNWFELMIHQMKENNE